jgi:phospholipase A1/A2
MKKKITSPLLILLLSLAPLTFIPTTPAHAKPSTTNSARRVPTNETSSYHRIELRKDATSNKPLGVGLFKPNYVLPAYLSKELPHALFYGQTPQYQPIRQLESKSQLSFFVPIIKHLLHLKYTSLNFAYTQQMYWQVYSKYEFFREINYQPEIYLQHALLKNHWLFLGVVHESNGRGGEFERSWNRVYADLRLSHQNFLLSIKPWVLIFKNVSSKLHNPDIERYRGNGRFLVALRVGHVVLSFSSRNNLQSGFKRGAETLSLSYDIDQHYRLYAQAFMGYGQNLIEYRHHTRALGIGLALNDWL